MSVAVGRIDPDVWTKERFLAWSETQAGYRSYEFDGIRPLAMAPATLGHNDIARNIREVIRSRLPGEAGVKTYGPRQPIETVGGALREPDAFVASSWHGRTSVTIPAPIVVFELLSPAEEDRRRDGDGKVAEYMSVPTILRYVVVESECRAVRVFWRKHGEGEWRRETLDSAGPLRLPEFDITLDFSDIYEGVEFD